ncbi:MULTISPECIES: transposase [Pseudomonas]|uniref:transposase n=1 Tax=Pseudomonas TaxID=286 RepID=UPI001CD6A4AC|nr:MULTISPECIES: transposase [Pseudomonas]MCG0382535.1 transposase [Pseudomonas aeruginosa]MCG0399232.1 transposase [Pseudomonas aeruginosa]MCG0430066.1 transposase [Pseudomonas aeruginosa]MCJ1942845.1 transposase [Pseudomonas aeruginosa]MCL8030826.1 transposase [Pseudomonas aeruginosa]
MTQFRGVSPYLALRLVAEYGTDLIGWRTAYHFTSWLTLAPTCRITDGKVLPAHTRKTKNRVTAHLRLAALNIGKANTTLSAFYRRLSARIAKAKAVSATARKIAILFYNAIVLRHDLSDPRC